MTPVATLAVAAAGPTLIDLGEGAPWWAKLAAGVLSLIIFTAPAWFPRLMARRSAAQTPQPTPSSPSPPEVASTVPAPTSPPLAPPEPEPEIALIAETLRGYRDDLRLAQSTMAAADQRHREEMAAAERRHQASMAEVKGMLDEREKTIVRLEAMIDVLTGRRQGPPPHPQGPSGL